MECVNVYTGVDVPGMQCVNVCTGVCVNVYLCRVVTNTTGTKSQTTLPSIAGVRVEVFQCTR